MQRAGPEGTRPLLMGGESPVERMRHLMKEREASYAQAHQAIDTERKTPAQVAADVVRLANNHGGMVKMPAGVDERLMRDC